MDLLLKRSYKIYNFLDTITLNLIKIILGSYISQYILIFINILHYITNYNNRLKINVKTNIII